MTDQNLFREVLLAIGRLEGKMDSIQQDFRAAKESIEELEVRVRAAENKWAWVLGASAVIAFVAPYAIHLIHLN